MKIDHLPEEYIRRTDQPQFDDTGLKDEWQLPVYMFARGIQTWDDQVTVIDVGCGSAYKLRALFWDANKVGVEANPKTLEYIRENRGRNDKYDIYASPEEFTFMLEHEDLGQSIELHSEECLLICSDVIEHVDDPVVFFEWLLKAPWKNAVISTPIRHAFEEAGPPGNIHHRCEWSFEEFYNFLKQWSDEVEIKLHVNINPVQRTQMAWLVRKSATDQETESPSGETGESTQDSYLSSSVLQPDISHNEQRSEGGSGS